MNRIVRDWVCPAIILATGLASMQEPALGRERLLRCATSQASTGFGHSQRGVSPRRAFAPLRNAMFFSHPGSACRWKVAQHHG